MPSRVREEDGLLAVGEAGRNQIVIFVDGDGDDAARHHVREVLERRLLDRAVARGEEDELAFFFKIANGQDGAHIFAGLQVEQALHGLALACGAHVGNLVDLEPVDAAGVGEAEQVGVRGVDDELRDEIFFARLHARAAGAAATLLAIDGDGRALQVALVADGDGDLLVGDEVFELQLGGLVDDLGAARVAVLVADFFEFLDDDGAQLLVAGENRFVLGDLRRGFRFSSFEDFVDRKLGEAIELQFEDGVDLAEREAALFAGQALAVEIDDDLVPLPQAYRFSRASARECRCADDADDACRDCRARSCSLPGCVRARGPCAAGKTVRRCTTSTR